MLNYETLLSSYDDKLTLLQWLKKVEAALKDASAVAFKVNKKGDATLTFSIVFEDGSEIESGEIVLQQGESGESAAIVNGHLILTLTNGDELDAGQLLNGDLNVSGNLSVTGKITGGEIVEDMTGYRFEVNPGVSSVVDCKYAGVVKNGNKLTFALLAEITPSSNWEVGASKTLCFYYVPATIWSKLVPSTIGGASAVSCLRGYAFQYVNSGVAVDVYFTRGNLGQLMLVIYPEGTLTANNTYTLRVELTFLLSDNLAA